MMNIDESMLFIFFDVFYEQPQVDEVLNILHKSEVGKETFSLFLQFEECFFNDLKYFSRKHENETLI